MKWNEFEWDKINKYLILQTVERNEFPRGKLATGGNDVKRTRNSQQIDGNRVNWKQYKHINRFNYASTEYKILNNRQNVFYQWLRYKIWKEFWFRNVSSHINFIRVNWRSPSCWIFGKMKPFFELIFHDNSQSQK